MIGFHVWYSGQNILDFCPIFLSVYSDSVERHNMCEKCDNTKSQCTIFPDVSKLFHSLYFSTSLPGFKYSSAILNLLSLLRWHMAHAWWYVGTLKIWKYYNREKFLKKGNKWLFWAFPAPLAMGDNSFSIEWMKSSISWLNESS